MNSHQLAKIFPMMSENEFTLLKEDIKTHGLVEPILTYQGVIIDGRNRYKACQELDIEPIFKEWQGTDVLSLIMSKNLHRRHLSESQRAMVEARLANVRQGERTDLEPSRNFGKVSQSEAGKLLNISEDSIGSAKKVVSEGASELGEAGRAAISRHEYAKKSVKLDGKITTAQGYAIPVGMIDGIQQILIPKAIHDRYRIIESMTTTTKGMFAVNIVVLMLKGLLIPLPVNIDISDDRSVQVSGTDIIVSSLVRIQVKCDYRAGDRKLGGTGNLFLQTAECNPYKMR